MVIAIIGIGNIGGALAEGLSKKSHQIILGVRDLKNSDAQALAKAHKTISINTVAEAVKQAEVILLAIPFTAVPDVAKSLGDVKGKIIIETTNAFGRSVLGYTNGTAALKKITGSEDIVKCFNSIGAEDLANPHFGSLKADTFVAGNSGKAKKVAEKLALDMGFGNCFDLGNDDAIQYLETLAGLWSTLAYKTGLGRRIALKVLAD
jgi:predicted dinucleotide-binding enzyme